MVTFKTADIGSFTVSTSRFLAGQNILYTTANVSSFVGFTPAGPKVPVYLPWLAIL